jgi:hypothetical protein
VIFFLNIENQKLHFAAAELYRVLFESKRCENSVSLLSEWGNALLDYAMLHCSNVSKFAEMHKSAGEKFEKVLELEPTFLDDKIQTIFAKQNQLVFFSLPSHPYTLHLEVMLSFFLSHSLTLSLSLSLSF